MDGGNGPGTLANFDEYFLALQDSPLIAQILTSETKLQDIQENSASLHQELVSLVLEDKPTIVETCKQLKECEVSVGKIEESLTKIEVNLDQLQKGVQSLVDKSGEYQDQMQRKRELSAEFQGFLSQIMIPAELIHAIVTGPIDERYSAVIEELESKRKIIALEKSKGQLESIPALLDLVPILQMLQTQASLRIREFLFQKIMGLSRPNTNIQILQQSLLKYKSLFAYLNGRIPTFGKDIRKYYTAVMRPIFEFYLTTYAQLMEAAEIEPTTVSFIGADPKPKLTLSPRKNPPSAASIFSLERAELQDTHNVIVSSVLIEGATEIPIVQVFYSCQNLLVSTVIQECNFQTEFFGHIFQIQNHPLNKVHVTFLALLQKIIPQCEDLIALVAMLGNVEIAKKTLLDLKISILDSYFATTTMVITRQFELILDTCIKSIGTDQLGSLTLKPHPVTQRYAALLISMHTWLPKLNPVTQSRVANKLISVRNGMISFLSTVSSTFKTVPQNIHIFEINNFDHIVSSCQGAGVSAPEETTFSPLLNQSITKFVAIEIDKHFQTISHFVASTIKNQAVRVNSVTLTNIMTDFAQNWKQKLQKMREEIISYFSSQPLSLLMLQTSLSHLLDLYKKLNECLKTHCPQFYNQIVSVHESFVPMTLLQGAAVSFCQV